MNILTLIWVVVNTQYLPVPDNRKQRENLQAHEGHESDIFLTHNQTSLKLAVKEYD